MIKRNLRTKNIEKLDFKIFHESSKEKEKKTLKNNRVSVISFFNERVVKNVHDPVSFQMLYPTIYSNKSLSRCKCCKRHAPNKIMFLSLEVGLF